MREGRRARHPLLHLVVRRSSTPGTRIGFSVGKRLGSAVVRNQVRRRLRMIVRGLPWRDGIDVVVLAKAPAAIATYEVLSNAIQRTGEQARAFQSTVSEHSTYNGSGHAE